VQVILTDTHSRSAVAPLELPSGEGVFPAASFLRKPRPVVGDTRCLAEDIAYACRANRRTVLVTAANEQIIRLFCSAHVVSEIFEHHAVWSSGAKRTVPREEFLQRYVTEYMPLMRVVPDDGVPESWLSLSERQRLATLALSDTDDIPSVKLALAIRGLYLSKDKPALRAVYGKESDLIEHTEWRQRLCAGGDAAELERFMESTSRLTALSGYGLFRGAQRAYDVLASIRRQGKLSLGSGEFLGGSLELARGCGVWCSPTVLSH
jgi:predicted nucleic acid-binding protein